ncbi:MAG: hypothetical protein R3E12_04815 [Candidatus Eisenbacteria bacterium]|uniref:Uncharacterized protein n=1 Tax=Eiseniibacteriota bacterium TaxID=2212470 RepID=A0A956LWI3_UNCEI|nr:hypothetical protein [Candidatus Eisenbacteria bacterium]
MRFLRASERCRAEQVHRVGNGNGRSRRRTVARWVALASLTICTGLLSASCQREKKDGDTDQAKSGQTAAHPPAKPETQGRADEHAARVAAQVMDAMGGQKAWNDTRYLSWKFMGNRQHYWDKWTNDVRIESNDVVILLNLDTKLGSVQKAGEQIVDGDAIQNYLERGYAWWVNDSYWMFMPYKLRDPGVDLVYGGEQVLSDGRPADVLTMMFESVGLTPRNKYDVYVDRESHLVVQWSYYKDRDDPEPQFTAPWGGWQQFGKIKLATQHGRGQDWQIHVYDSLPRTVFESFGPVQA